MIRNKTNPLILDAELSDPPSSRTCFRDVTLYAAAFRKLDVLVECAPSKIDFYWDWLKQGGSMDFVEQLIFFGEEEGVTVRKDYGGDLNIETLNESSLSLVISFLNKI